MAINPKKRVIVVGGGLAGLACTIKLAEEGMNVDLFSMVPVKRSHSVCAQGGINACNDIARQQGYSEWMHFDETVLGGDFLADQPPVLEMCNWAPKIIDLLDRMGVPFNRTAEGQRALRMFGGSLYRRTFYAGATTGQQLLYALDEQVRRWEVEGRVKKYEFWEFLWPVMHDGRCAGVVVQDMRTMEIIGLRGDAVVMATGGNGMLFGTSTMSVVCTGGAASRCYQAGAIYANPEMVQVHPTAMPGEDKCRVISESARGEGARVWVPLIPGEDRPPRHIPEDQRWYFLEDRYPKFGNLVPRDIATREIFQVCLDGRGVGGGNAVYLDLRDEVSRVGREAVWRKLGGVLEIYEKFAGVDPLAEPMKVFPAVHYTMAGLWTGFKKDEKGGGLVFGDPANMMTNVPGLYAMGEVNFAYHGANRLGANSLLSCIFDGLFGGVGVKNYCTDLGPDRSSVPQAAFDAVVAQEQDKMNRLLHSQGDENPYLLWQEMGREMTANCTVVRYNERLDQTIGHCAEWLARFERVRLSDTGLWTNQNLSFARAVRDMIILADATARGARARDESRGVHYKPYFPERDDDRFLKATLARYDTQAGEARIDFGPVDLSNIQPRKRTYGRIDPKVDARHPGLRDAAHARTATGDATESSRAGTAAAGVAQ